MSGAIPKFYTRLRAVVQGQNYIFGNTEMCELPTLRATDCKVQ